MVSFTVHAPPSTTTIETISSPARISFSSDSLVDKNITKSPEIRKSRSHDTKKGKSCREEFEFLSNVFTSTTMLTADALISEGKLLPFSQPEKLHALSLKSKEENEEEQEQKVSMSHKECSSRVNWFIDEDPSPRPPSCTVLWKELLKLKKHHHHASSLSPSPSSSSSSSSSSTNSSTNGRMESIDEEKEGKEGTWNKEKHVKRIKKGLERTRSGTFRIRPMVNVPICTPAKHNAFPSSIFSPKGNVEK